MAKFELSYCTVPFILDAAKIVRMRVKTGASTPEPAKVEPLQKHQPEADLLDELDRLIPFRYLQDFSLTPEFPGRNLASIAQQSQAGQDPKPDQLKIGDFYYPTTATKWSVFRGLALSSMAKQMLATTGGNSTGRFVMQCVPVIPNALPDDSYLISTYLYMLPPRPLAEHGEGRDGLYLITLVDERYYFQGTPATVRVTTSTTWNQLAQEIAAVLGITLTIPGTIPAAYGQPDPDSPLWCNQENAATLLDAVAYNIGRVVVRNLDGTYVLQDPATALAIVQANRGDGERVVRLAGGDLFYSGSRLPAGSLVDARNAVVPQQVIVTFPKYVQGDDPVPHYLNPRYTPQRPSCWYEESYGDVYSVNIPVASGGLVVSGLTGVSQQTVRTTAKAIYNSDAAAVSGGVPVNSSGLTSLALQVAGDYYATQVSTALDEVYPGTLAWTPEAFHDLIWTYSARARMACLRVMRSEWNNDVESRQYAHSPLSGSTTVPRGVGGPSVALTVRDKLVSGSVSTTLIENFNSGVMAATLAAGTNFPDDQRWRGMVDGEAIYFEGLSGGTTPTVVYRAIDGTLPTSHLSGATIFHSTPSTAYGVNLLTFGAGFKVYPGIWSSGGIQEAVIALTSGGGGEPGNFTNLLSGTITVASGTVINYSYPVIYYSGGTITYTSGIINYQSTNVNYTSGTVVDFNNNYTVTYGSGGSITYNYTTTTYQSGSIINYYNTTQYFGSGTTLNYSSGSTTAYSGGTITYNYTYITYNSGSVIDLYQTTQNFYSGSTVNLFNSTLTLASGSIFTVQSGVDVTFNGTIASGDLGPDSVTSGNIASGAFPRQIATAYQTSGLPYNRIYIPGRLMGTANLATTVQPPADRTYCVPFRTFGYASADRLEFNINGISVGSGKARAAIYESVDDEKGNLYPGNLVCDGGEFLVITTGTKSANVSGSLDLKGGKVYWSAFRAMVSGSISVIGHALNNMPIDILGDDSGWTVGGGGVGLLWSGTYGAFPASFPSGATIITAGGGGNVPPAVGLHFYNT